MTKLKVDMWMFGESHLTTDEMQATAHRLGTSGYMVTAADAAISTNSEKHTRGGVINATKKHVANVPLLDDKWHTSYHQSGELDIAARGICFPHGDIMVIGAYCRKSSVEEKLRCVHKWTQGGKIPFILAADFNLQPQEVCKTIMVGFATLAHFAF